MIKFLLDMGVSPICGKWLNEVGYDAVHLNDLNLNELPDNDIIELAKSQQRIILTCDNDFGTLMAFNKLHLPCVILFRLNDFTPKNVFNKLSTILKETSENLFQNGVFITVKEENYRIRRLPF